MARILYWNINNFSLNKIFVAAPNEAAAQAAQRNNLIVHFVMRGPDGGTPPDIIVVVEVFSRVREVGLEGGVLIPNRGAGAGVLNLLTKLRASLGPHWCVVPPLNLGELGQREAVAVFYNSQSLKFTGPNLFYNRFPGTPPPIIGQGQPVALNTFQSITEYPTAWKNALPNPNNPIPQLQLNRTHDFHINGVPPINEWQLAGQWEYYSRDRPIPSPIQPPYARNRIFFPNAGCRGPFWTQFLDLTFQPNGRLINLFSVHTSPASARRAVMQMQRVNEMRQAVAPGAVNVILGDFNVDSFSPGADAYTWMIIPPQPPDAAYTMALDPRVNHAGAPVAVRKPYCMTHLLPPASATPFNNFGVLPDAQHNVYPRYGYMGSAFPNINDSGAIDNFFTAYGQGAGGPATHITVVNQVVGTPYDRIPAPSPQVTQELRGGLPYAPVLFNQIPLVAPRGGIDPPNDTIQFPAWNNLGRIYSTSDHLPLMIDV